MKFSFAWNKVSPHRTHGIRATYIAACRCEPCKAANSAYLKAYRLSKVRIPA